MVNGGRPINHPPGRAIAPPSGGPGGPAYSGLMYLLRYKRDGEWRLVVIAEAYSVAHARMVAAGLQAGRFVDGHRVSRASVARLPPDALGRVLELGELKALVEGKKKPSAPFVRPPHGDAL